MFNFVQPLKALDQGTIVSNLNGSLTVSKLIILLIALERPLEFFQVVKPVVVLKSIVVSPVPWKAPGNCHSHHIDLCDICWDGKVVKAVAPATISAGIVVNLVGNFKSFKLVASWKTLLPREPFSPVTFVACKSLFPTQF